MASDYAAISAENRLDYGRKVGSWGKKLLSDRYADRTHFIYELLQNAEDAMRRRRRWTGQRSVSFELSETALRVSHFGVPFSEADVRGICGIGESTKDLTSIGRFGIGFKSVYALTDRPEIHSGDEHFAIDSYVHPSAIPEMKGQAGETTFIMPLRPDDDTAVSDIMSGLQRLGPRVLLFLRQIDEISWSVDAGASGRYWRSKPKILSAEVRRVGLHGETKGEPLAEETWMVFSREVSTDQGEPLGYAEIAFALGKRGGRSLSVQPIHDSALVVFFPTVLTTNLGFLVQGPYRTTPSRDNVPPNDPWNRYLIKETASLLVEALVFLREHDLLSVEALRCLPLDRAKFPDGSMFALLFSAVHSALLRRPLLPAYQARHVAGLNAKLARGQELRSLFSRQQLTKLFQAEHRLAWLSEDITQDRTPQLRSYLMQELGVAELTPDNVVPRLTKDFLEAQSDKWILSLYEFLNNQPALLRQGRLNDLPLVRLEDGTHTSAKADGRLQAFLPSAVESGFRTVGRAVCATDAALAFLRSLGLSEPDPVDDVIGNVLPRYSGYVANVGDRQYAADLRRICTAFATDSKGQRDKLVSALKKAYFVTSVHAADGTVLMLAPTEVYLATQRLKDLFEGCSGVFLVDDSQECLHGEDVRELLEACGATRYLLPVPAGTEFTWQQKAQMRRKGGCTDVSSEFPVADYTLRGLGALLEILPTLDTADATERSRLLWEALCDMEDRRGANAFVGTYRWTYYYQRTYQFDAAFVRQLNEAAWVPDGSGKFHSPSDIVFEETGWKGNPFLLSKIHFKPPVIEALAKEAGFEPGVLELLRKHGVTSVAALIDKLGIEDTDPEAEPKSDDMTADDALTKLGIGPVQPAENPNPEPEPLGGNRGGHGVGGHGGGGHGGSGGTGSGSSNGGTRHGGGEHAGGHQHHGGKGAGGGGNGARPFISYVGAHPEEEERDPDGLKHQERMDLEEQAINLILQHEPGLHRTPMHNPGFDLTESDANGKTIRWIEVKAMTGDLHGRPVGLSDTQFRSAQEHGEQYWLYVVEHAGSPDDARIVRIQDPAGRASTFTFDHGWLNVAEISTAEDREEAEEHADG